jgi:hypothetical protein
VPDVEGFDVSVGKTIIVSVGCSTTCSAGVPEPLAGVSVDCGAAGAWGGAGGWGRAVSETGTGVGGLEPHPQRASRMKSSPTAAIRFGIYDVSFLHRDWWI